MFNNFDWLYQTVFVEKIRNINIAQLTMKGNIKIEKVISENVLNENVNTENLSNLIFNNIKDLQSLDNIPTVTEGVLNTFAFFDYTVLIMTKVKNKYDDNTTN